MHSDLSTCLCIYIYTYQYKDIINIYIYITSIHYIYIYIKYYDIYIYMMYMCVCEHVTVAHPPHWILLLRCCRPIELPHAGGVRACPACAEVACKGGAY